MSPEELEIHKAATAAFIAADASSIALTPYDKVSDGAGGFRKVPTTPRAAQVVRMIPRNDKVPETSVIEGRTAALEYTILGEADAIMERYDTFMWRGNSWQIAQMHLGPDYEKKGDVVRRA